MAHDEKAPYALADLPAGKVHYRLEGPADGRRVVCVHGIGTALYCWDWMSKFLADKGYRVLSFDLYGRGFSADPKAKHKGSFFVDQMHELMKHKDVGFLDDDSNNKVAVVGHSMGGGIAVLYAHTHPECVSHLALIAPAGAPSDFPFGSGLLKVPWLGAKIFKMVSDEEKVLQDDFYDMEVSKDALELYALHRTNTDMSQFSTMFVNSFKHFPLNRMEKEIRSVGANDSFQTLIVWGLHDITVPYDPCCAFYKAAFSGQIDAKRCFVRVLDKAKHAVMLELKDEVHTLVGQLLDGSLEPQPEKKE